MSAELLMLVGGVAAFGLTVAWVRSRDLSERAALGWLAVATLLLLSGLFPDTLMRAADASRLSYPSLVLFVALGLVYVFAFGVSVGLTRLDRRSVRLTQEVGLLEARVRELEAAVRDLGGDAPPRVAR